MALNRMVIGDVKMSEQTAMCVSNVLIQQMEWIVIEEDGRWQAIILNRVSHLPVFNDLASAESFIVKVGGDRFRQPSRKTKSEMESIAGDAYRNNVVNTAVYLGDSFSPLVVTIRDFKAAITGL